MAFDLNSIFGSNLAEVVKGIIGEFKVDPTKKAELQAMVDQNASVLAQKQIEMEEKLMDVAGQNIRAETTSDDKYTSRARPTFLYLVEAILGFNYILIPTIQAVTGRTIAPIALPGDLLTLFGFCVGGYIGARSYEKTK